MWGLPVHVVMKACVLQPLWATSCQHSHVLLLSTRLGLYARLPHLHSCAFSTLFSSESLTINQHQSRLLTDRCHRIWCWLARFSGLGNKINYSHISHLYALEATSGVTVRCRGSKVNVQYMWDPQRGAWWIILGLLSEKTRQLPPGAHHLRFGLKSWRNSPPQIRTLFTV